MADATIDLQASNLFSLNSNFKTQSSGTSDAITSVTTQDELGNVACESMLVDITSYTQNAKYCGSDFVGDLATFLTTFGDVQDSKCVTGITINMTAGDYCTIDIEGHNHFDNAHVSGVPLGRADVSDFLPHEATESFLAWDGFGVPDFGVTPGGTSSPSSATVTFSLNHIDQIDEAGTHLVGKNITPRCELSLEFAGIPASITASAIEALLAANTNNMYTPKVDSIDINDSNSDFDSMAFTAHAFVDLETV